MRHAFFNWWFGQLRELIPESLRSRMRGKLCLVSLEVQRESLTVRYAHRNREETLGTLPLDNSDNTSERLRLLLMQAPSQPDRIVIRLSPDLYLQRELELPLATEENLYESIGFQIEQLTPFSTDQVEYLCGIKERMPENKKLLAWVVVAPRKQLDKVLRLLGEPAPLPVAKTHKAPPAKGFLELPYRPFGKSDNSGLKGTLALGLALIIAVGVAGYLHIQNQQRIHAQLETALREVRGEAAEAAELREHIEKIKMQAEQLGAYRAETPQLVAMWDDLSRRLDDDTWLQRLDLRNNTLVLHGVSGNAATLIEQLEASPHLKNVRFTSSVTRDRSSSKDRFSLSASLATSADKDAS